MIRTWSIVFTTFLSFCLNAQNIKKFEDDLGIQGEIRFSGTYPDTALPKQGPLDIRWRKIENKSLKTYRVKGQTRNHQPTGKWTWEEAEWEYKVNAGTGITPSFSAQGARMKWEGNLSEGIPEGKWTFTLDSITSSGKPIGILIKMDLQFKNGKPSGVVSMEDNINKNKLKLKGICENGIATGTWNYTYKNQEGITVREERVYKKGLLTEVRTFGGTAKSVVKFEDNDRFAETAGKDSLFEGKKIGNQQFQQDEYGGIASELLHENLHHYFLQGWVLEVFPFEIVLHVPVFKRLEYPLNSEELEDISRCRELVKKQKDTIEELLSGNIDIHRSRSGELDTTISFLQLNYERLDHIDSLLYRTELPFFTYKNRYGQGIMHWIHNLNQLRYAQGEIYDSLKIELPAITSHLDSLYIFKEFRRILENNETVFPAYYQTVEKAHISLKREGELRELEDKIVERLKEQQIFYSEKEGMYHLIYTRWIKGEIQELLREYARTDEYEEALRTGTDIVNRLDSIESWKNKIEIFEQMPVVLKSQYTYLAYNPYSGENDIEITIKKRFLNNILTNLWPYMLKEIDEETEWDKWVLLWNRQFKVFNYLMEFASKDDASSKRIDKRVRKEKKPEKILRIILQQPDHTEVYSQRKDNQME